jgi:hypothetical protein
LTTSDNEHGTILETERVVMDGVQIVEKEIVETEEIIGAAQSGGGRMAHEEDWAVISSHTLLDLTKNFTTSSFGCLTINPCSPISSLNFMLNSITLVGNDWIEALGNLSISPKSPPIMVFPQIQPALCSTTPASDCETMLRVVSEVESSSDSGGYSTCYYL